MRHSRWAVLVIVLVALGCGLLKKAAITIKTLPDAEEAVRTVLAEQRKIRPSDIPMDRPISEPPVKADEEDLIEVVMELEERAGIEVPDEAIEKALGGELGEGPPRITPKQLAKIVFEAARASRRK